MILSFFFVLFLGIVNAFFGGATTGAVGVGSLGIWCAMCPSDSRRLKVLFVSILMPCITICIVAILILVTHLCPLKYDLYLHSIDHALGFCPSQLAARLIVGTVFYPLVIGSYYLVEVMMVAGYGWALFGRCESNRLLITYALSSLCAPLYMIVPASGPAFILGRTLITGHPPPPIALVQLSSAANCIPSVHLSTALLIWYFNRSNRLAGKVSLAYVFATAFATLGLGEHYLIDLVLSFPFTLFLVSIATRHLRTAAISIAVVIAWLTSIRLAIHDLLAHPLLLWSAAACTVTASIALLIRLPSTRYASDTLPSEQVLIPAADQ